MTTSNLNNRIDKDINEQEIPSSLKSEKYNKVTVAAIEEGRKIAKDSNVKGYHSVDELKKALELWLNMKFVLQIAFKKILSKSLLEVKRLKQNIGSIL